MKGMQKAREDRYQMPHELLRDIEAAAQGGAPLGLGQEGAPKSAAEPKLRRSWILKRARRLRKR